MSLVLIACDNLRTRRVLRDFRTHKILVCIYLWLVDEADCRGYAFG